MAEALFQVLLDNLSSLIKREIGLILGVDKEMKKLSSTLTTIQVVLEDAEDKQFESKPIQNWLRKLNDLAYDIDDVLDECAIELSKFEKKNNKFNLKKVLFGHKIGRRLKEMAEKLDDVAMERKKFHLRESSMERQNEVATRRAQRETGSVLSEPNNVFGRDEEKEKIVDILVNHVKDRQQLTVLPIIGLGGLGKTTLAQLVYNDPRIKEHFDLKLWICVSDNFDPKILIEAMLMSATGSGRASDSMPLDALQRRLWELLSNKRYLLILDDVWNDDQEKWAMLKNILACCSRGASIIVTTRLKKVVEIMGTLQAHFLKELSEEHCWLLFKQRAFGQEVDKHPNLEPIGRQIVKKCAGVPLAAKALGGLLRFKEKEKEWIDVKESELWDLEQETSILPSLRLSYRHLPLVLRRCFAYCALFPKDWEIEKKELIYHWMAHGCISSNGRKEVEDIGDEIWNELVLRSLLSIDEGETTCKMHDLVHDLALSIMENQVPGAHAIDGPNASNNKIRQLHVSKYFETTFPTSIQLQVSTLTTLVNFSRLKMLTISGSYIKALPSSIDKLKQLRHLKLSGCSIRTLPNTISGLQNLQILDLENCEHLVSLPKNMRYVVSLRHLCLERCDSLFEMPSKIGELTSLKTLSVFIVGDKIGNQLGELECLNLGGNLVIQHLERVKNQKDVEKANLREKSNLRCLDLRWEKQRDASKLREIEIELHPNIEYLRVFGFQGRVFPVWMRNPMMANVIEIYVDNCQNCLHLPPLGNLPRLKRLSLKSLGIEFIAEYDFQGGDAFQSLEKLELTDLPNLKGLFKEEVKEMFPNLQKLKFWRCPSLRLPRLPSRKKLEGNEKLTLSSFSKLDNLTSLEMIRDGSMTCTPNVALDSSFSNLKELIISGGLIDHTLPEELLQHLTTLEKLYISFSEDLVELPDGIKYLCSLKTLELYNLPKMVCLPKVIQHLHSLQVLSLEGFDQLTSLPDWLDKLISLEKLSIRHCPRIASLPSSIRGMTNLQTIQIWDCPELIWDWQNIKHIPNLDIRKFYD